MQQKGTAHEFSGQELPKVHSLHGKKETLGLGLEVLNKVARYQLRLHKHTTVATVHFTLA